MSDIISCFTAHFYLLQGMRAIFTANFGCVHLSELCKSCSKQQQQPRMKRKEGKRSTRVKKLVSLSSEHPETVLSPLSFLFLLRLSSSNNVKEICSQLCLKKGQQQKKAELKPVSTFYAAAQKDMAIFCMQAEAEKTERGERESEERVKRGSGS